MAMTLTKDDRVRGPAPLPRLVDLHVDDSKPAVLQAKWDDGFAARVDLTGVIARSRNLAPLADPALFRTARIIDHGVAVGWGDAPEDDPDETEFDYSASALRDIAEMQQGVTPKEFGDWMEKAQLTQRAAGVVFDRSERTIRGYLTGEQKIPTAVQLFVKASAKHPEMLSALYVPPGKPGRPKSGRNPYGPVKRRLDLRDR